MTTTATGRHNRVFTYGTLLKGCRLSGLLDGADFMGEAKTEPRFTLYDLGTFPALAEGGSQVVGGEVYHVDDQMLAELDRVEGVPTLYQRKTITLSDGRVVFAYVMDAERAAHGRVIQSGSWRRRHGEQPGFYKVTWTTRREVTVIADDEADAMEWAYEMTQALPHLVTTIETPYVVAPATEAEQGHAVNETAYHISRSELG
jgi:gamma-glutamylaminecyclotransferase